jgi:hypothetical protein
MYLLTAYSYLGPILLCVYFHADSCSIVSVMCCIIFIHCFSMLSLYIVAHMTYTLSFCKISVTVIHYYKILLCLWYFVYHSCIYVAIVSIKLCLSVNHLSKCGGEYKIARKVDILPTVICSISMHLIYIYI